LFRIRKTLYTGKTATSPSPTEPVCAASMIAPAICSARFPSVKISILKCVDGPLKRENFLSYSLTPFTLATVNPLNGMDTTGLRLQTQPLGMLLLTSNSALAQGHGTRSDREGSNTAKDREVRPCLLTSELNASRSRR
jgi:hypothetical protein